MLTAQQSNFPNYQLIRSRAWVHFKARQGSWFHDPQHPMRHVHPDHQTDWQHVMIFHLGVACGQRFRTTPDGTFVSSQRPRLRDVDKIILLTSARVRVVRRLSMTASGPGTTLVFPSTTPAATCTTTRPSCHALIANCPSSILSRQMTLIGWPVSLGKARAA